MVSTDNSTLNIAGVDPRITELRETRNGNYEIVNRRTGPARDVRSMAVYENIIFAAGEDFDVYTCKSGCQKLMFHQQKNLHVASDIVVSAGENYLDVMWKQSGEDEPSEGSVILQQHYEMIHLAKIFTPKKRIITCWAASPYGNLIAIGTCHDVTIYKISPMVKKINRKVVKTATLDVCATSLSITKNLRFYVAKSDFEVLEFDLETENGKELKSIISQADCGSVSRMVSSPCGNYICVLTTRSQIFSINTETGESRLLKVDLPIDMTINSTSAFVLSTITPNDSNNQQDTKKIFHEVNLSNGLIKRSACSNQLRMLPSSPKSLIPGQPIYLIGIDSNKIMTASYDGHWSILDVESGTVVSAQDGPLKANKKQRENEDTRLLVNGMRLREEVEQNGDGMSPSKRTRRNSFKNEIPPFQSMNSRIVQLEVTGDEIPKTAGFKIKKFGMQ